MYNPAAKYKVVQKTILKNTYPKRLKESFKTKTKKKEKKMCGKARLNDNKIKLRR